MPVRSTVVVLCLSAALAACGGDSTPAASEPAPADAAPTTEADPAVAAPDASRPAAAEAASDAAAEPADGSIAARMMGEWRVSLPPEDAARLDAARKTLETTPDDAEAKMLVGMMEAMLGKLSLNVTGDTLAMAMGDQVQAVLYTVTAETESGATLSTKEADGRTTEIQVTLRDDGVMVWTKAGEKAPMMWARK